MFVCVADGCNWGEKPREAARRASASFVDYLDAHSLCARDAHDYGALLLDAVVSAHNAVVAGIHEAWEAGTTTLIGAAVFPLADADKTGATGTTSTTGTGAAGAGWGVCVLSIGDCKCFLRDARSGRVRDITPGNRGNLTDATDPGGRLGPYLDGGLPDTRNLALFYARAAPDDVLVFCSDGVHDNLDPQSLGVDPGDLAPAFAGRAWDAACALDRDLSGRVKERFAAAPEIRRIAHFHRVPRVILAKRRTLEAMRQAQLRRQQHVLAHSRPGTVRFKSRRSKPIVTEVE